MLRTFGRLFLLRFLPRRLLPILTAYELYRFVRGRRAAARTDLATTRPATSAAPGGRARVG